MLRHALALGMVCGALVVASCSSSDAPAGTGPEDDAATSTGADVQAPPANDGGGDGNVDPPGAPSADALLGKVASCGGTAIKSGFGLDGAGSISIFQCGTAVYWKADMDVDCDGIQTPPCDTDPQGQPQTSIVDLAPKGDVDPTLVPYFVIPLGKPETNWYKTYGIALGQVGAVIYKGKVYYGIFADEAGGFFIGEVSYAMCQLFLGKPTGGSDPCDPNTGGIDPADITYVTFTGADNQIKGNDIYDHAAHTQRGASAAAAWLAGP